MHIYYVYVLHCTWGPWNGAGGAGGGGGFKSSDRGMGPRGHGKRAWRGRVCGWWQPCETWGHELEPLKECQNIHEVWVVGAMWDHGAMSHRCQGVEGMGVMRWTWEGCMGGAGGESGEGGAGGHALGPFKVI